MGDSKGLCVFERAPLDTSPALSMGRPRFDDLISVSIHSFVFFQPADVLLISLAAFNDQPRALIFVRNFMVLDTLFGHFSFHTIPHALHWTFTTLIT